MDRQTHIMICPGYAEMRLDKYIDEDRDLLSNKR